MAVFVDGCFWHGCPEHFVPPKANATWWREKIAANQRRDAETTDFLAAAGWSVIRVWEHVPADDAIEIIRTELDRARRSN